MLDKSCTTIKGALNELDAAGLLERRRTGDLSVDGSDDISGDLNTGRLQVSML